MDETAVVIVGVIAGLLSSGTTLIVVGLFFGKQKERTTTLFEIAKGHKEEHNELWKAIYKLREQDTDNNKEVLKELRALTSMLNEKFVRKTDLDLIMKAINHEQDT